MTPLTDRTLATSESLDDLRFDERGLIPVIAQQAGAPGDSAPAATDGAFAGSGSSGLSAPRPGAVLMLAWANREALERTLETGWMHYWSRSRRELWKKGVTSGNLQKVISLHADCDRDTVLARVRSAGPACHTDEPTCFGAGGVPSPDAGVLDELWRILESRDRERPEGSYTTRLLDDENLRLKKLGEEVAELLTALVRGDGRAPEEGADLLYHLLVALKGAGHEWSELLEELARRRS